MSSSNRFHQPRFSLIRLPYLLSCSLHYLYLNLLGLNCQIKKENSVFLINWQNDFAFSLQKLTYQTLDHTKKPGLNDPVFYLVFAVFDILGIRIDDQVVTATAGCFYRIFVKVVTAAER